MFKMSMITKEFKILDKNITVRFSDENHAQDYFDFSFLDSDWHRKKIGEYHFSQLLGCIRNYWYWFKYDRELTVEQKGIFLIGKIVHKHIQNHLEKTVGFVVIEHPIIDDVSEEIQIIGKIDVINVKEKRETDVKTTRYLPVLADLSVEAFEQKFGKYLLQIMSYAFFLNNTYYKEDPIETLRIALVDKADLYTKLIEIDYDDELAKYFYLKLRARAEYLHEHLLNNEVPEHCEPSKNCMWCAFVNLCPEGTEIQNSLTVPVNFESMEYKKKFGENKKPYWKYDPDAKCWIKSKEFLKFLQTELKYTTKQIGELA